MGGGCWVVAEERRGEVWLASWRGSLHFKSPLVSPLSPHSPVPLPPPLSPLLVPSLPPPPPLISAHRRPSPLHLPPLPLCSPPLLLFPLIFSRSTAPLSRPPHFYPVHSLTLSPHTAPLRSVLPAPFSPLAIIDHSVPSVFRCDEAVYCSLPRLRSPRLRRPPRPPLPRPSSTPRGSRRRSRCRPSKPLTRPLPKRRAVIGSASSLPLTAPICPPSRGGTREKGKGKAEEGKRRRRRRRVADWRADCVWTDGGRRRGRSAA